MHVFIKNFCCLKISNLALQISSTRSYTQFPKEWKHWPYVVVLYDHWTTGQHKCQHNRMPHYIQTSTCKARIHLSCYHCVWCFGTTNNNHVTETQLETELRSLTVIERCEPREAQKAQCSNCFPWSICDFIPRHHQHHKHHIFCWTQHK